MKNLISILILMLLLVLSSCKNTEPACPVGSVTYFVETGSSSNPPSQEIQIFPSQVVEIKGREVQVDRVINGLLCNDSWQGTIYVPCEIEIKEWVENPAFLKNCELNIEPGTVVYVAAHNDEPYYQGCSCHTSEGGE